MAEFERRVTDIDLISDEGRKRSDLEIDLRRTAYLLPKAPYGTLSIEISCGKPDDPKKALEEVLQGNKISQLSA